MRGLLQIATLAAGVYALLLAYLFFFQSRLIYFPNIPGRALIASPDEIGLPFQETNFAASDGVKLHGWYVPNGAQAPVVLFCHGNAGNISHRLEWLRILHELGYAVLIFDYRGYGNSAGAPSERGTYLDARAAWEYLAGTLAVPAERIVVFGESLGGAIAAHLAREVRPAGLILTSSFSSVPELGSDLYPFMPVRLLSRFEYATAEHVAQVHSPLLVIHSRDDEIVPFAHGERIFARGREPKQLLEIFGDHNNGFIASEQRLVEGLRRFQALLPPS